jgi:hypothetical protein
MLVSERQGSALPAPWLFSRKIEVPGRRPAAPWHNYTTAGYMNVRITTDLHIAAELNIIISKSITLMTFTTSYAQ